MYGVAIALRPVLCEDIGQMIQDIVTHDRERFHAEYFQKLAGFVENKIEKIEMEFTKMTRILNDCEYESYEMTQKWNLLDENELEWAYILDDIFINSNKVVDSKYRPDPDYVLSLDLYDDSDDDSDDD